MSTASNPAPELLSAPIPDSSQSHPARWPARYYD